MATNEILPFAYDGAANVLTQAEYQALADRAAGMGAGLLPSVKLNKILRQTTLISAAVAQVIVDTLGQDVLDDGDVAALTAQLTQAFQATSVNATAFNREKITTTAGQTSLVLTSHTYVVGANQLNIFRNGGLLNLGDDWTETSSTTATLATPAEDGDEFILMVGNPVGSIVNALASTAGAGMVGILDAAGRLAATNVESALAEICSYLYGDAVFVATGGDDSAAVQAFIDANKGKTLVIKGDCTFAGVLLSGSSYDSTRLVIQSHVLKTRPTSGTNNFGGAWVGLIIKDCTDVHLHYRGNGKRSLQPDEEHCHLLGIAGAQHLHIHQFDCQEIRGDGIYVSQSDWASNTQTTVGLVIDSIKGYNSADDGRNLLSVIACDGLTIGTFQSINIGGVVGGVRQPGGLDIEPNQTYQTCEHISVGTAVVESAGTQGFGIFGTTSGVSEDWIVRDVSVGSLSAKNTNAAATSGHSACSFQGVNGLTIRASVEAHMSSGAYGVMIDKAKGVIADITVRRAPRGAVYGQNGSVRMSKIATVVQAYNVAGVQTSGVADTDFSGHVKGATSSSSTFAVQVRAFGHTITQSNVRYSIDAPNDGLNARGYVHGNGAGSDTITFSNCVIADCMITGWATWTLGVDGFGVAGVRKRNLRGFTQVNAQPSDGGWTQGDFVEKLNPSKDGNNMTILGWVRLTTGTGNVSGTDWAIANVSHVSPAA